MRTVFGESKKWLALSALAVALLVGCKDSEFARRSVEVPVAQFYGDAGAPYSAAVRWQLVDTALMNRVCANPSLRELSIVTAKRDGTPILPQIAKLPELESLSIIEASLRDDELSALSQATSLTALELSRTGISGEGLWHLAKLPIKRLVIRDKQLSAEGLKAIASMPELEELELNLPDVHWAELPELASKKSLRSVAFVGGSYSFRKHGGLKCLEGATNLKTLNLSGGNLNDRAVQTICSFQDLRELTIGPSLISEEGVKCFAKLQHLKFVDMPNLNSVQIGAVIRLAESVYDEHSASPLRS